MSEKLQAEFLEKSLMAMHQLRNAYDNKANFLLGISGVLFILSMAKIQELPFLILAVFSLVTSIFCILSIILPFRRVKDKASKNLFCWWGVKGKKYEDYLASIKEQIVEQDDLVREYSKEIYSLYHNSLRHKAIFLKLAGMALLAGFVIILWYLAF